MGWMASSLQAWLLRSFGTNESGDVLAFELGLISPSISLELGYGNVGLRKEHFT